MATNRNSEHLRYRYGICLNDNCQKCKNIEVQQVSARKDFVCEECGKPLRECPPPKSGPNKMVIAAIAAVIVIAVGVGCFLAFTGGSNEPEVAAVDSTKVDSSAVAKTDTVTIVRTDTIKQIDTVTIEKTVEKVETPKTTKTTTTTTKTSKASGSGNGTIHLSYGIYKGDSKNGYPDGMGRLTYSTSRQINRYDSKGRMASAGDYVIGEFVNGFFVQGKHYSSNGSLIETLMIGTPATSGYESK